MLRQVLAFEVDDVTRTPEPGGGVRGSLKAAVDCISPDAVLGTHAQPDQDGDNREDHQSAGRPIVPKTLGFAITAG